MPVLNPTPTASLGDVIAAAYERAEAVTSDPERASRLAAAAVVRLLVRTGNVRAARKLSHD
jgi:hypothetical protein